MFPLMNYFIYKNFSYEIASSSTPKILLFYVHISKTMQGGTNSARIETTLKINKRMKQKNRDLFGGELVSIPFGVYRNSIPKHFLFKVK